MMAIRVGVVMHACLAYFVLFNHLSILNYCEECLRFLCWSVLENDRFACLEFSTCFDLRLMCRLWLDIASVNHWLLVSYYWKFPLVLRLDNWGGFCCLI